MQSSKHHRLALLGGLLVTAALGGCTTATIDPQDVASWANSASALGVYTHLHAPVSAAVGQGGYTDPSCPAIDDDQTTLTITGGCTDSEGEPWVGEVTVVRGDGPRDLDLAFTGYGRGALDFVTTTTGSASVRQLDAETYAYELDIVREGPDASEIVYSGTVVGDYDQATLWNGAGMVTRSGMDAPGVAMAQTVDQLVDDALCSGQSASGETTIELDGQTIVITYDGELDCDDDAAARWSLDGVDQGLVEGVSCSIGSGGGAGGIALVVGVLLGLGRCRRRLDLRQE